MSERYVLIKDDDQFGLRADDVLICEAYWLDPNTKRSVRWREGDGFKPECNLYNHQVWRIGKDDHLFTVRCDCCDRRGRMDITEAASVLVDAGVPTGQDFDELVAASQFVADLPYDEAGFMALANGALDGVMPEIIEHEARGRSHEAQEARETAVEAFLASQRRPVPESTPEAPQRSQENEHD